MQRIAEILLRTRGVPAHARRGRRAHSAHRAHRAHHVRLLTKPGCHLCDEAREVVARVVADLGVPWDEIDITGDDELRRRFAEQIPVTMVDGQPHDFWRVDERRLRRALGA